MSELECVPIRPHIPKDSLVENLESNAHQYVRNLDLAVEVSIGVIAIIAVAIHVVANFAKRMTLELQLELQRILSNLEN